MNPQVAIPNDALASFCRKHRIRRLSIFGSALRDDFGPESDIDVLVEFEEDRLPDCSALPGWSWSCPIVWQGRRPDDTRGSGRKPELHPP